MSPQQGALPEIRATDDSIVYYIEIAGGHARIRSNREPRASHLVLRCDAEGNIWVSLTTQRT